MITQYRRCYACIQFAVVALCCLSTNAHAEAGSAAKPGALLQQRQYYRSEVYNMGFFEKKEPSKYKLLAPEYYFPERATQNLIKAALAGDVETSRNLVAAGADPNAPGTAKPGGTFGFSPLHFALAANSAQGMRVLVAVGADPELPAEGMGSPLLFAVMLNNPELLSQLLDLKSVEKLSPSTQQQLLFESARRNAPACLELLLQRGVPIDIKDSAGFTLFLRSLDMGEFDLSLWLLQKGAAIDYLAGGKLSPTDSVLFELSRMEEGGPDVRLLLEIKRLMQERGAKFPVTEHEKGVPH